MVSKVRACYTITEPGRLVRELAEVRVRGWATAKEEMSLGSCSLAAPVRDHDGRVVAAVGIVVSSRRGSELVRPIHTAARRIEHTLWEWDDASTPPPPAMLAVL